MPVTLCGSPGFLTVFVLVLKRRSTGWNALLFGHLVGNWECYLHREEVQIVLMHKSNATESALELEPEQACWMLSRVENFFHMPARVSGPEAWSRPAEPHVRWIAKVLWCPGEATSASPCFIIRPNALQLAGMGCKCAQAPCDGQQPQTLTLYGRLHDILTVLSKSNGWLFKQSVAWGSFKWVTDVFFCMCLQTKLVWTLHWVEQNSVFFKNNKKTQTVLMQLYNPGSYA